MNARTNKLSLLLFLLMSLATLSACSGGGDNSTTDEVEEIVESDDEGEAGDNGDNGDDGEGSDVVNACSEALVDSDILSQISGLEQATTNACAASASLIVGSFTNMDGIELEKTSFFTGETTTVSPCIEAVCDADFAYVAINGAQHWEYIDGPPNSDPAISVFKIPYTTTEHSVNASQVETLDVAQNCVAAYDQYLTDSTTGTSTSPSGICIDNMDRDSLDYFYINEDGNDVPVAKLRCVGTNAFSVSGTTVHGSSEAAVPDPYGNPAYLYPDIGSEEYKGDVGGAALGQQGGSPILDFCGAHSHHHGFNSLCFEKEEDNTPTYTHAEVRAVWDRQADLSQTSCTEESPIIAWMQDGTPVQGPCVCETRNEDGTCDELTYVRSSYVYEGLKEYGDDPEEEAVLGTDNMACSVDDDCGSEDMMCSYTIVNDDDAIGGTSVAKRCTLIDYGWCAHPYVDRSLQDMSGVDFSYADQCNGVSTADGYRYVSTASFPYHSACMRYAATGDFVEIIER